MKEQAFAFHTCNVSAACSLSVTTEHEAAWAAMCMLGLLTSGSERTKVKSIFLLIHSAPCPWGCSICEGINYPFVSQRSLTNYTLAD